MGFPCSCINGSPYGLFVSVFDFVGLNCNFHLVAQFEHMFRSCCRCFGLFVTNIMSSAKKRLFKWSVFILTPFPFCLFRFVIRSFM